MTVSIVVEVNNGDDEHVPDWYVNFYDAYHQFAATVSRMNNHSEDMYLFIKQPTVPLTGLTQSDIFSWDIIEGQKGTFREEFKWDDEQEKIMFMLKYA